MTMPTYITNIAFVMEWLPLLALCEKLFWLKILCINFKQSLMELHKRRKALTEPEVRYYMKQILTGCIYLHDAKIIHRDLKLGNLFLDDDMNIKIGDFGLATTVQSDKERKR